MSRCTCTWFMFMHTNLPIAVTTGQQKTDIQQFIANGIGIHQSATKVDINSYFIVISVLGSRTNSHCATKYYYHTN